MDSIRVCLCKGQVTELVYQWTINTILGLGLAVYGAAAADN